mmetsp:Transcript_17804/g.42382  ORF Transcript_17804/g.42382 Transcript_17804/m.42382 type:complete len:272 (-) Transcript_17804:242-1057(-)
MFRRQSAMAWPIVCVTLCRLRESLPTTMASCLAQTREVIKARRYSAARASPPSAAVTVVATAARSTAGGVGTGGRGTARQRSTGARTIAWSRGRTEQGGAGMSKVASGDSNAVAVGSMESTPSTSTACVTLTRELSSSYTLTRAASDEARVRLSGPLRVFASRMLPRRLPSAATANASSISSSAGAPPVAPPVTPSDISSDAAAAPSTSSISPSRSRFRHWGDMGTAGGPLESADSACRAHSDSPGISVQTIGSRSSVTALGPQESKLAPA